MKKTKKMMTGGMSNPNARAVVTSSAKSLGKGPNTTVSKQTVPGGTSSGGVNTVPKDAVPAKQQYGGSTKSKMMYSGSTKGKMMMKKGGKKTR